MAITPTDISNDYIINAFSGSLQRGEWFVGAPVLSGRKVTFTNTFYSVYLNAGDVLRIFDGSTTVDYSAQETSDASGSSAVQIGFGGGRSALSAVDEFVAKINASALEITAVDLGGTDSEAAFTLTPKEDDITITITESPASGDGSFGANQGFTVVTAIQEDTVNHQMAPYRFSSCGAYNLRGQSASGAYKIFAGERKT